jgi:uncharacterized membrane protein
MVWFIFAFLTALSASLKDVFSKKSLKNLDEYVVSWSLTFFTLPFLFFLFFFIDVPEIGNQFLLALIVSGTLNIIAVVIYMKAIKCSDLSVTIPIITFTPLFLLITSPLILGELPKVLGIGGVLLIVLGSYMLNFKQTQKGYLAPFKALIEERGPKLMLLVAFIWSITSTFDKIGVQNSSSLFWVIAINTFITIGLFPIMLFKTRNGLKQIKTNLKILLPISVFSAATSIFQMMAITMTYVTYVISVKRTSTIMSVLFGYFIFKEGNLKERLMGTIVMVIGVILISVS